jgi:PII-like signaling protein
VLNIILVGIGSAFGSIARYLISTWVQTTAKSISFPVGTLTVYLVGCFVIGILAQLAEARGVFTSESRAFVFIGIGATVLRGMMGYGANTRQIHTFKIEALSEDMPIIVEVVDTEENLEKFLDLITPHIRAGLVTMGKAAVKFYHAGK